MKLLGYTVRCWPVFDIFNWHWITVRYQSGVGSGVYWEWSWWLGFIEIKKPRVNLINTFKIEEEPETEVDGGDDDG